MVHHVPMTVSAESIRIFELIFIYRHFCSFKVTVIGAEKAGTA